MFNTETNIQIEKSSGRQHREIAWVVVKSPPASRSHRRRHFFLLEETISLDDLSKKTYFYGNSVGKVECTGTRGSHPLPLNLGMVSWFVRQASDFLLRQVDCRASEAVI